MDKRQRQHNVDLDIRVPLGPLIINVFCINYEAPIPRWSYGNHSHSSYELHFVPQGRGKLRVGSDHYPIVPGTFYLTGPGVFHEQQADATDPMVEYCLNFEVLPGKLNQPKKGLFQKSEMEEILQALVGTDFWFGEDRFHTVRLFEQVFAELESARVGYHLCIQNWISLIVLNALRCYSGNPASTYAIPKKVKQDNRRYIIDKFFEVVQQPVHREDLAQAMGTSVRQMNRVLVEIYGMSFQEKLITSRLDLAKDLLIHTTMEIKEIASRTGFADQAVFGKSFKKRHGESPLSYRRSFLKDQ